jgi:hypothetical protein
MKAEIKETHRWVRGSKNICSRELKVVNRMKAEKKDVLGGKRIFAVGN